MASITAVPATDLSGQVPELIGRSAPWRVYNEWEDRFYVFPPPGCTDLPDVTPKDFASVTSILDATWYKPWIPGWKVNVAARYVIDHADLIARMVRDGQGPDAAKLITGEARRLWETKARCGTYVHDVLEKLILRGARPAELRDVIPIPEMPDDLHGLLYDDEPIENVAAAMIAGFRQFNTDWDLQYLAAEMSVYNPDLEVAGTLDMIVRIRNARIVRSKVTGRHILIHAEGHDVTLCIDAKTGRYPGDTVREQLASYRRMPLCDIGGGRLRKMPHTDAAAVLHLRPEHEGGYELTLIAREDDLDAWNNFQDAVSVWHYRKSVSRTPGTVIYPPPPDGSEPPIRIAGLRGKQYGAVPGVLFNNDKRTLAEIAAMTEKECLKLRGIGEKRVPVIRQMLADHRMHLKGEGSQATQGEAAALCHCWTSSR